MVIKVGKLVNTHGIKGEVKIKSGGNFSANEFFPTKEIYIDQQKFTITSYRKHNKFHLVTFLGIDNINQVLHLKNKDIYVSESIFWDNRKIDYERIKNYQVYYQEKFISNVSMIIETPKYKILVLDNDKMVPLIDHFIIKITRRRIDIKNYDII